VERAVYFQTWMPYRPNTHPVHPPKHQGMIEDLVANHATMLAWSMMGGGAVSLPFLESQIYGNIPPAPRFHGFMNEKEFNQECLTRGITPFAVIYQAQSWEFPVRFNTDHTAINEINILRHEGDYEWYGTREFTQDTYPALFPRKFRDYFPGGLVNSNGEEVTDLWDECASRDIYGGPVHSGWVEVEGYWHTCRHPCRNNPVWQTYIKKQAEIIIDAGAVAIQLDETENPLTAAAWGGCFCKDCMKQFRAYLKRRRADGTLPEKMAGLDLDAFDYGVYLRERHVHWPDNIKDIPFVRVYWDFQIEAANKTFQDIIRFIRDYGQKKYSRTMKVSGNFFNMHMLYRPSLEALDLCVTENRRTVLRRHEWYRMAAGCTGDKPLVVAESPYDGFMQKFVELIHEGKADDYYRLFVMEAAAHGISMCYPYGSWMGNKARDAFYPPRETAKQTADFLYDYDRYFGKRSGAKVLVLYDFHTNRFRDWQTSQGESLVAGDADDLLSYKVIYEGNIEKVAYYDIGRKMIDRRIFFDVCVLGDGIFAADDFGEENLASYDVVVSAGCGFLTKNQAAALKKYAAKKPLLIYGSYGENLPGEKDAAVKNGARFWPERVDREEALREFCRAVEDACYPYRIVDWDNGNLYIQQTIVDGSRVLHVLNYCFDKTAYRTIPQEASITVRSVSGISVRALTLDGSAVQITPISENGDSLRIYAKNLPCYTMFVFEKKE
jgi:hypothetical protein